MSEASPRLATMMVLLLGKRETARQMRTPSLEGIHRFWGCLQGHPSGTTLFPMETLHKSKLSVPNPPERNTWSCPIAPDPCARPWLEFRPESNNTRPKSLDTPRLFVQGFRLGPAPEHHSMVSGPSHGKQLPPISVWRSQFDAACQAGKEQFLQLLLGFGFLICPQGKTKTHSPCLARERTLGPERRFLKSPRPQGNA